MEQQYEFPWAMMCKLACQAMVTNRTFEQQVELWTQEGMVKYEAQRAKWLQMKRTNREREITHEVAQ